MNIKEVGEVSDVFARGVCQGIVNAADVLEDGEVEGYLTACAVFTKTLTETDNLIENSFNDCKSKNEAEVKIDEINEILRKNLFDTIIPDIRKIESALTKGTKVTDKFIKTIFPLLINLRNCMITIKDNKFTK